MRKQYHFREVFNDVYIWDVDRLIVLSQGLIPQKVFLNDIQELNEPYWFEDSSPTTAEIIEHFRLIQQADLSFPILLCAQGRVMDGMHRVAKAKLMGDEFIYALQFKSTPAPDFINIDENDLNYER